MTTTKTTKKAPAATKAASSHTTRVCIKTAEIIAVLAESNDQPPALIAGTLADIGINLLVSHGHAEAAGTSFQQLIMSVIQRRHGLPSARCEIPILLSDWASDVSQQWENDMGMDRAEWLRCMVEIGINHYHKPALLVKLFNSLSDAYFLTTAVDIRTDVEHLPEAEELLRTTPAVPKAFLAFEKILATRGGAA